LYFRGALSLKKINRLMLLLLIETSSVTCSVAISDNNNCLFYQTDNQGRNHAALLNVFIENGLEMLRRNKMKLDGVAVSSGPGSYTGLRIGVSAAKGICYALDIPLISINTLNIIALETIKKTIKNSEALYVPMIDARRMEVFNAIYTNDLKTIREARADVLLPDSFDTLLTDHLVYFSGNGAKKFSEIIEHQNARFIEDIHPDAKGMIALASQQYLQQAFEDVAYFAPHYVKEFYTTAKPVQTLNLKD
jgi:tRNA threonylcarbamoyladenosine biosynthesis protein TsaB